jgi:uncharacterized protein YdaU (DUF1376 family)
MHYYYFHIADFRKDADWLSVEEAGIYRWLLDQYYLDEKPVCLDKRKLMRRMRLTSDQAPTLDLVLSEFFIESPEGYKHPRVEAELSKIYAKSGKARDSANRRWHPHANAPEKDANALRTHSEGNANGMLPKTQDPIPKTQSDSSPNGESENAARSPPVPYQQIIDLYHKYCPTFPKVVKISTARKKSIRARWKDEASDLTFWENYFKDAAKSKFCNGHNDRGWVGDIDFLIRERTMIKMQEGAYHREAKFNG